MEVVTAVLLMITGIVLILLVLLQRGGGSLVSALNGKSGDCVFGTSRDRVFSRITTTVAVAWVILAGFSIHALS